MGLHPFIVDVLENLKAAGQPALSAGSPDDARRLIAAGRAALGQGPAMAVTRELRVPTRCGSIPGRLLAPHDDVSGLVVYLHGGGWVAGAMDDYDALARELAMQSGCALLLVDYRLAPEHPFPAALEDAVDTITWASASMETLAGRRVPLVVAGDSAGANLATVAARALRGKVGLALQVLVYPVTDCDFDSPSYQSCSAGMPVGRTEMEWFFGHYAPAALHGRPEISPLRATNHDGVPPAFIITAAYDVLHHEGQAYAEALRTAGVPTIYRHYDGVIHDFLRLHNHLDIAASAVADAAAAIAQAVAAACPTRNRAFDHLASRRE